MFELIKNERILFVAKTKNASLPGGRKDTLMKKDNVVSIQGRDEPATDPATVLDEIVREGARRMLQAALETEVTEYVERHANLVDIQLVGSSNTLSPDTLTISEFQYGMLPQAFVFIKATDHRSWSFLH